MKPVLSSAEMAQADRYAIDTLKIPASILMEHAALALADAISLRFSDLTLFPGVVVAGTGNNGGDVLAAARILVGRGASLQVFLVSSVPATAETKAQLAVLKAMGILIATTLPAVCQASWVLDGIFGIGLNRQVEGEFATAIEWINARKSYVVCADIPSGLNADTGNAWGPVVGAAETISFGFLKRGLVTGQAADFVGKLSVAEIQIPREIPGISPQVFLWEEADTIAALPKRRASGHKGDFGHVLVVAGDEQTLGACALSALGALYTGAGMVTIAAEKTAFATLREWLPAELMLEELTDASFQKDKKRTLVVGPGLGQGARAKSLLRTALLSSSDKVLDADALNLMASEGLSISVGQSVATPHPKEASRILGSNVVAIEADRFSSVVLLAKKLACPVLLKGRGTLIASPLDNKILVVNEGTSALAKGGSGDLLTGIIAALIAAKVPAIQALAVAAWLHGRAASYLEARGEDPRTMTSSNLAKTLSLMLKDLA